MNVIRRVADDSAYVLLADEARADYALVSREVKSPIDDGVVTLEWDASGRLIGVVVEGASKRLMPEVLEGADRYEGDVERPT